MTDLSPSLAPSLDGMGRGWVEPAVPVAAVTLPFDGAPLPAERQVAVETPVNFVYGSVSYAVMMATPADLEDFAAGFSLTEGVVGAVADIRAIRVEHDPAGLRLHVDLAPARLHALLARRRAMAGRTSCGVCGIEDLVDLPRASAPVRGAPAMGLGAIRRAIAALPSHQPLNARTHAMHAAAWASAAGAIEVVREDVGRHNALDKLIGALLRSGVDPGAGFILVTSRCSFEMVEKAAAFGAATLVALSAPTTMGIERARQHGMTLLGAARAGSITRYAPAP